MKTSISCRLLAFLLCLINFQNVFVLAEKKSLCFMLYQMADNNLESAIRADLTELTQSKLVKDPSVTTWVYFDALNLGTPDQTFIDATDIPDLYQPDGTPVGTEGAKFEGSRYFTYDTANQRVVVNTTLEGEQNSDSPNVVYEFVVHALKDFVAKGSQEFFFAMSSHGGGYSGFGGDENQRRRRRLSGLENYQIVETLQQALADVEGAPSKLDMLGFDACLMQAAGALDDFSAVTKYYLASEAVEPGHGWAYYALNPHDNVEELGKEIVTTFVEETQNFGLMGFVFSILNYQSGGHQVPKTLAVVDAENGYPRFNEAFEALSEEFYQIMLNGEDAKFHAQLGRARAAAVKFYGVLDLTGASPVQTTSEVDIGSFLAKFSELCDIDPSSEVFSKLEDARAAYEGMFVIAAKGEGTPAATGATAHWPSKYYYSALADVFENLSLNETSPWYSQTAPRWNEFLDEYLHGPRPVVSSASVCTCGSDIIFNGDLLIDTKFDTAKGVQINSKIPDQTDLVWVDVGIDITSLIGTDQYNRRKQRKLVKKDAEYAECTPNVSFKQERVFRRYHESQIARDRRNHLRDLRSRRLTQRIAQEEEDFLYGYGASVEVKYGCGDFSALWDGRFFLLESPDGRWDWAYVEEIGNGAKNIPVLYFPNGIPEETREKLVGLVLTFEEALEAGAMEGSLSFSVHPCGGTLYNNLALYTYSGDSVAETPRSDEAVVVPIVYVYGVVFGVERSYYLGGFNGTSFAWSDAYNVTVTPQDIDDILTNFNLTTAVVEVYAVDLDFDGNETDSSFPSNYTGYDFEFFEAGLGDFGLLGLDVYDGCEWDDAEDVNSGSDNSGALEKFSGIVGTTFALILSLAALAVFDFLV